MLSQFALSLPLSLDTLSLSDTLAICSLPLPLARDLKEAWQPERQVKRFAPRYTVQISVRGYILLYTAVSERDSRVGYGLPDTAAEVPNPRHPRQSPPRDRDFTSQR